MYNAGREGGRMKVWDGRNYKPGTNQTEMLWGRNSSDVRGRGMDLDSYMLFASRSLVAHEALHAYLSSINFVGSYQDQENWIKARQSECAG
jgi:hypothetical protein